MLILNRQPSEIIVIEKNAATYLISPNTQGNQVTSLIDRPQDISTLREKLNPDIKV